MITILALLILAALIEDASTLPRTVMTTTFAPKTLAETENA